MEAAEEIARQLRLRDIGGIIVVDFIDMYNAENRNKLFKRFKDLMKPDKAKHHILPHSKFGLVQITRERVRPQTIIDTLEKCPTCGGTGEVEPSFLIVDKIENTLRFVVTGQNEKGVTLLVHPFIYAYINKGVFSSIKSKWKRKYKNGLEIKQSDSLQFLEYKMLNKRGEEIKLT
jgi:ribonuclease G